jgi:thioester reductase-like protein
VATKRAAQDEVVLFTGFPGFIGARLLPRLMLLRPGSTFRCLVQEKFLGKAREDLGLLEKANPHMRGRTSLLVGDITEARLGLESSHARSLRKELTSAYHLAAVYDLAVARDVGQRINVLGTRHVLEFLGEARRLERLHYVSTAYVSGTAVGTYRETDLDVGQRFKNFYEETKFLAEVEVVGSRLPQTIYRPAIVVGDSETGETAKFDGPYFVLSAMRKAPSPGLFMRVGSGRNAINLVPVDFVVEALAQLSSSPSPKSLGRTYHLTDPEPLSVGEIEDLFAKALGKSFAYVPLPMAVAKLALAPRGLQRFLGLPLQTLDYFDHPCRYDATQATADLASLGVRCPRLADYLQRLVAFYLAERGGVRKEAMI